MGRNSAWWIGVLVLLVLGLAFRVAHRWNTLRQAQEQHDRVATDVALLRITATTVAAQATQVLSDEYVENHARSEGKMARKGEWVVQPFPLPGQPLAAKPTPTPSPTPTLSPWDTWWALFFAKP